MKDLPGVRERPSENRIREALALGGIDYFVVACPKDLAMYRDAVKTSGNEGKIAVCDLADFVARASGLADRDGGHRTLPHNPRLPPGRLASSEC